MVKLLAGVTVKAELVDAPTPPLATVMAPVAAPVGMTRDTEVAVTLASGTEIAPPA